MTTSVSEFLKLGGCEVLEVRREGRVEVIEGRVVKAEAPSCPRCGRERMWRHGKRKRRISHAPYDDTPEDPSPKPSTPPGKLNTPRVLSPES
jgi:transposase